MGEACEIIISCVGDDNDLREITFSPTGCFQTMQKNTIFIDHSTTSFDVAQEVNRFAVEKVFLFLMHQYLAEHLEQKTGSYLLCSEVQKNKRISLKISSIHTRIQQNEWVSVGAGQLAKMVNQICISGLIQGLAEGLKFGLDSGLDMQTVLSVISKGAAQSWQMENRGSTMLEGKYDFGFAVDHMIKDLTIVLDQGTKAKFRLRNNEACKRFL